MSARGCKPSRLLLPALLLLLLWLPRLAVDAAGAAGARWNGEGTSPNLQSIFLGRCNDYRPLLSPEEQ